MSTSTPPLERPRLLLVDDDEDFCAVLSRALERRGYDVRIAADLGAARTTAREHRPAYAVVDLRIPGPSGLEVVAALVQEHEGIRIVMLTGYASIATAVEAIKLGATHYLTKPADADEIVAAFGRGRGTVDTHLAEQPLSVRRLTWEHIQRALADCGGNISAAARRLGMHRRTLQRKLTKRPVQR